MLTVKLWSIQTPDEAFLLVLLDVVVSTFKFGGNRGFFRADTANFVVCRGGTRAIPLLVVSDFRVSYVMSGKQNSKELRRYVTPVL